MDQFIIKARKRYIVSKGVMQMYENLNIEMVRNKCNILQLSKKTGIKYQTLVGKVRGESQFKFDECLAIKHALHSEMPLEVLFMHE